MILYNLTSAPATYPVTSTEAKLACEVTHSDDDTYIDILIAAASGAVEEMSGKQLITQTWTRTSKYASGCIELERVPLISVTSMAYYDRDDASQTLTVSDFYIYSSEDRAFIEPKADADWPDLYDRSDALTITFTTGYSTVPAELKQAILLLIRQWYDSRMAVSEGSNSVMPIPFGVDHLVNLRRVGWIG